MLKINSLNSSVNSSVNHDQFKPEKSKQTNLLNTNSSTDRFVSSNKTNQSILFGSKETIIGLGELYDFLYGVGKNGFDEAKILGLPPKEVKKIIEEIAKYRENKVLEYPDRESISAISDLIEKALKEDKLADVEARDIKILYIDPGLEKRKI